MASSGCKGKNAVSPIKICLRVPVELAYTHMQFSIVAIEIAGVSSKAPAGRIFFQATGDKAPA
jgi:hypothetical protein